jgi:DNA-directed RNA polymerase specialized sigma54-like protein
MISRRRIVDSIIHNVHELGYRVRDKAQLPGIVQELVSTCLAIEEHLKAVEREDGRGLGRSTLEERLVYIIRNYRRSTRFLAEIESAIGPGSRKLQQGSR